MEGKRQSAGRAAAELLILFLIWLAAIILIHPRGNFPTQDDWHYSWSAQQFANTGDFHMTRYGAPSLRAQVVWGGLWIRAFGFSLEVLRASTLFLSASTLLLINRLLAAISVSATARWIASLALLFNPMFLLYSCTFMTEIPFVFTCVVTYAFLAAGIERDRPALVALGTAMAVVSCFIRQTGAMNIAATGLLLLAFRDRISRRWIAHGTPLLAGVGVLGIVAIFRREWLAGSLRELSQHYQMWYQSTFGLFEQITTAYHYLCFQATNSALFFLALAAPLVLLIRKPFTQGRTILLGVVIIVFAARAVALIADGLTMPFSNAAYRSDVNIGQTFNDLGVGPLTLTTAGAVIGPIHLRTEAKAGLTLVASVLGAVLLWSLAVWLPGIVTDPRRNIRPLLATSFVVCGTCALILSAFYFDRYSLDSAWALVLVLPLLVPWQSRGARLIAVAALALTAWFSVTGVHDYFAWNRARWQAYASLRTRGIPADQIDGGFETIGWEELVRNPAGVKWPAPGRRPYAILYRPTPGTVVIGSVPYRRWLGLWNDQVHIVRRTET